MPIGGYYDQYKQKYLERKSHILSDAFTYTVTSL